MCFFFVFVKHTTAYVMRISVWSSDVCSSDLLPGRVCVASTRRGVHGRSGHSPSSHSTSQLSVTFCTHAHSAIWGMLSSLLPTYFCCTPSQRCQRIQIGREAGRERGMQYV